MKISQVPWHLFTTFSFLFLKIFWCGPFLKSLLNLLQYCSCFMFWFFGPEACGILAPRPEIEPTPPALEGKVLTTGPPGKSPTFSIWKESEKNENIPGHAQPLESPRPEIFHLVTQQILLSTYDVPDTGTTLWAKQMWVPPPSQNSWLVLVKGVKRCHLMPSSQHTVGTQ